MARWSLVLACIAACYQPSVHEGAPCGPGATCPTGQECRAGTCFFTSTPTDSSAPSVDAPDVDGQQITADAAPDGPPVLGAWATPVLVPSLELAQTGEDDPSVTNDRLTVVIAAKETVAPISINLFIGTRATTADAFTVTPLTVLDSTADENSPEISPDGNTIYFTSNRGTNNDVYISTKSGGTWSAPTLVTELSTHNEGDFAISPDGLTAVTCDEQTQHHFWLYQRASTTSTWGTGVMQTPLEITTDIAAPTITNGAATIYFHAGQPRDVYVSHRVGGVFTTPTAVTELNTSTTRDAAPFVLQSDRYMIFERDYNIYETTR